MFQWYQGKTLAERRAMLAGRDPKARRRAEQRRHEKRKNSAMVTCNRAANLAIGRGDLERGPCEVCGTAEHIHGHHEDYSRPLHVRWLCRLHHLLLHGQLRPDVEVSP